MKTTLNQIRACSPCGLYPRQIPLTGFCKLRAAMGKGFDPEAPITITQILDSNGLDDALWCLKAVQGYEREKRLYAVKQARKVQHLNTDPRVEAALKAAEDFANGLIGAAALAAAGDAAWDAAWAAAGATAGAAARAAAWAAARATAGAAAWDAAWAAARAAAWAAAGAAAWAAAGAAALAAAGAAALAAALAAARADQAKDLREMCAACE
jgi:hypothetical protein